MTGPRKNTRDTGSAVEAGQTGLIGICALQRHDVTLGNGDAIHPYGPAPVWLFHYCAAGYVFCHLTAVDRPPLGSDSNTASADATLPEMVGNSLVRRFHLDEPKLTFAAQLTWSNRRWATPASSGTELHLTHPETRDDQQPS